MEFVATPAYIVTVGDDHTIVLPKDIPVGAQVTITVIAPPPNEARAVEQRRKDFAEMRGAVKAALLAEPTLPHLSDTELDALIKKARKATREP